MKASQRRSDHQDEIVEIRLLSLGRAAGSVTARGLRLRWTAIEANPKEWFIILQDECERLDASLLRGIVSVIERNLISKAA